LSITIMIFATAATFGLAVMAFRATSRDHSGSADFSDQQKLDQAFLKATGLFSPEHPKASRNGLLLSMLVSFALCMAMALVFPLPGIVIAPAALLASQCLAGFSVGIAALATAKFLHGMYGVIKESCVDAPKQARVAVATPALPIQAPKADAQKASQPPLPFSRPRKQGPAVEQYVAPTMEQRVAPKPA
jgi:hypothetical protein